MSCKFLLLFASIFGKPSRMMCGNSNLKTFAVYILLVEKVCFSQTRSCWVSLDQVKLSNLCEIRIEQCHWKNCGLRSITLQKAFMLSMASSRAPLFDLQTSYCDECPESVTG